MIRLISIIALHILCTVSMYARGGRGYDPNAPDIGLPEGNEVFTGLLIAIIAIPIGYAILNSGKKDNSSEESLFPGCLGLGAIGIGIICLLPLLAWLCSILSAIFAIGFIALLAIGVIVFCSLKLNKHEKNNRLDSRFLWRILPSEILC